MSLTSISLPHLPSDLLVHLALYTNLRNAQSLRSQLLTGNPDFEYAFIDATTIFSSTHLHAAIFRACNDYMNKRIRSRNIHSEIVYCLGYTNNIATTLNTFGITDMTSDMLIVKVSCPSLGLNPSVTAENVEKHLQEVIEGEALQYNDDRLRKTADQGKVRNIYKLGTGQKEAKARSRKDGSLEGNSNLQTQIEDAKNAGSAEAGESAEIKELEMQVLGLMALRGAN